MTKEEIRRETIRALLVEDSIPKFGELASDDLVAIWELGHDGNGNHRRTWNGAIRKLRRALETKAEVYFPGWQKIACMNEHWLKGARFVGQTLDDIKSLAELKARAE